MTDRFLRCLAITLTHEGGYVDHPRDPGSATNLGVTIGTLSAELGRPATKSEVRALTVEKVRPIYRRRYWLAAHCDACPPGLDLVNFDGSVNSGVKRGIRWLQKGVGARSDGVWGPETQKKVRQAYGNPNAVKSACAARMGFLRALRTWGTFGRGWSRRVADIEARAVIMAGATQAWVLNEARTAKDTAAKQKAGSGASAGAGAATTPFDVPWEAMAAFGLVALLVAALLFLKGRHNDEREAALMAHISEAKPK